MGLKPTKTMKRAVKLSEADARSWSEKIFRPPVSDPPDPDCTKSGELDPRDKDYQERLRQLNITSGLYDKRYDRKPPASPMRPMPENRSKVESAPFGLQEPSDVPEGKMTIREALRVLTKHAEHPETWTAADLAFDTNLDKKQIETVLRHFHILEIDPRSKDQDVTVAQAWVFKPKGLVPESGDKKARHMAEKVRVNP